MYLIRARGRQGFSLIEVAIVIVIVGMLVGGILIGNNLIVTANNNAIIKEVSTYREAIALFEEKYKALPGDFASASVFWAAEANGNGNGLIEEASNEHIIAWRHLILAGLVNYNYNGINEEGRSKIGDNIYYRLRVNSANIYDIPANRFNGFETMSGSTWSSAISAEQAFAIDRKLDDGLASRGWIRSIKVPATDSGSDCALTDGLLTANYTTYTGIATYNNNQSAKTCNMIFYINFN